MTSHISLGEARGRGLLLAAVARGSSMLLEARDDIFNFFT